MQRIKTAVGDTREWAKNNKDGAWADRAGRVDAALSRRIRRMSFPKLLTNPSGYFLLR